MGLGKARISEVHAKDSFKSDLPKLSSSQDGCDKEKDSSFKVA